MVTLLVSATPQALLSFNTRVLEEPVGYRVLNGMNEQAKTGELLSSTEDAAKLDEFKRNNSLKNQQPLTRVIDWFERPVTQRRNSISRSEHVIDDECST